MLCKTPQNAVFDSTTNCSLVELNPPQKQGLTSQKTTGKKTLEKNPQKGQKVKKNFTNKKAIFAVCFIFQY